jgi:PBP1b-binding outer membrane lipoprotein LpoB
MANLTISYELRSGSATGTPLGGTSTATLTGINSGTVSVVQSGEERNEIRDERNDQQTFASDATRKRWREEKGADFMLNGIILSVVDQYKKQKTIKYQVNLELTDLETNEKVWIGEKEIKKFIKN